MPLAGDIIEVGRIPGWPIGQTVSNADSATFTTTETVLLTLQVPLVAGRIYRVMSKLRVASTAGSINEGCQLRLREDNSVGNELDRLIVVIATVAGTAGYGGDLDSNFTAVATATKTFVVTGQRISAAAGTQRMEGSGASPNLLTVRYESG